MRTIIFLIAQVKRKFRNYCISFDGLEQVLSTEVWQNNNSSSLEETDQVAIYEAVNVEKWQWNEKSLLVIRIPECTQHTVLTQVWLIPVKH